MEFDWEDGLYCGINYTGTMIIKEALTSRYKIIHPTPSMNSNTHIQKYPNMHHTNGKSQTMEKNTMGQRGKFVRYHTITKKENNPKVVINFYIMAGKSTIRY